MTQNQISNQSTTTHQTSILTTITIIALNTKNICTNLSYIGKILSSIENAIIFVCETWLTPGSEHLIINSITNHAFHHKCSDKAEGGPGRPYGGIGWIIPKEIKTTSTNFHSEHVSTLKINNLAVIGVYLPTSQGIYKYQEELDIINSIIIDLEYKSTPYAIMGDFNADINRAKMNNNQDKALKDWYTYLNEKYGVLWVSKLFTQQTWYTFKSGSLIDHIFTGNTDKINMNQVNIIDKYAWDVLNNSDHKPVGITINLEKDKINNSPTVDTNDSSLAKEVKQRSAMRTKINWSNKSQKKAYSEKLTDILREENIIEKCKHITADNKVDEANEIINTLHSCLRKAQNQVLNDLDKATKNVRHKGAREYKNRSSLSEELRLAYELKSKYNKRWLETRVYHFRQIFNYYRARARKLEKEATREGINIRAKQLSKYHNTDRNKMWRKISEGMNQRAKVNIHLDELAESYQDTFANKENLNEYETKCEMDNDIKYRAASGYEGDIKIKISTISDIISKLKNKKATGHTGIANEMYKHGGKPLAIVVCTIITKIVNLSYSPQNLNIGLTFPIIKDSKKSNSDINNTRPLTISDTIAIIFEKYLLEIIDEIWEDEELQFGFRRNCSTNHAVFMLRETLIYQKNRNKRSYLCFMDFSKAFDKVVRAILLHKLSEHLDLKHWGCLYSYYNNSSIIVSNEGLRGKTIATTTGVKQGGPLSPKLFSIYVSAMIREFMTNHPHTTTGCNIVLYADDTVIIQDSQEKLQHAIDDISKYCALHKIKINAGKTKCMITGKPWEHTSTIRLNDEPLEIVNKIKYLGWWLEANLDSKEHIRTRKLASTVASYQLKKIGFHSEDMSPELKVMLRNTYCRSKMNYAIENTFLHAKDYADMNMIECKILKSSLGLNRNHSNTLLNNALQITPLERQIKIRKMNFTLELLKNQVTRTIIEDYIENTKRIPKKSLISEVLTICEIKEQTLDIAKLKTLLYSKVKELEHETDLEINTETSLALGYLFKHRCYNRNKEILSRLLHWENANELKSEHKKKARRSEHAQTARR